VYSGTTEKRSFSVEMPKADFAVIHYSTHFGTCLPPNPSGQEGLIPRKSTNKMTAQQALIFQIAL
jgi:hypothetical protein